MLQKCNFLRADSGYLGAINNKLKILALAKDPQRSSKGKKMSSDLFQKFSHPFIQESFISG